MTSFAIDLRTGMAAVVTALLLVACASSPGPARTGGSPAEEAQPGRYTIQQDRAPTRPLDPSRIREVVPRPETRTLAGNYSPYTVNGRTYRVMSSEEGYQETGLASWYGEKFHGHRTSNGERFDMYQVSAAHRSLPIPSYLRVTNLRNGREVVVRVNDRGPFHSDRIIDLSYAAAWKLGFAEQGTARVRLEAIVPDGQDAPAGREPVILADTGTHILQVGAYSERGSAERVRRQVASMTEHPIFIREVKSGDTRRVLHRVRIGPIPGGRELEKLSAAIENAGLGRPLRVEASR